MPVEIKLKRQNLKKLTAAMGLSMTENCIQKIEQLHSNLALTLLEADLRGTLTDKLALLIPDACSWFTTAEIGKKSLDFITECPSYPVSNNILNGLEQMLEWLLRVSKCWLDSKNSHFLCSNDLECIVNRSPIYKYLQREEASCTTIKKIIEDDHMNENVILVFEADCIRNVLLKNNLKVNRLFNSSVQTINDVESDLDQQQQQEMVEIKHTLEKLMQKINLKSH